MVTILLAIDPGAVTGLACVTAVDAEPYAPGSFVSWEVDDRRAVVDEVHRAMTKYPTELVIVTERFTILPSTAAKTRQYDALYLNGWLDGECHRRGIVLHEQTPTQAKRFATDHKLRKLGWYHRTKDGHANDAARHLLVAAVNDKGRGGDVRQRLTSAA